MKKLIPQQIKNYYHLIQAILANIFYGFPSKKIEVIGVTGTNGKTTTVQMIVKILEEANYKTSAASTINFKIGKEEWVNKTKFTTLSAWKIQSFIKKAVKSGCQFLVLETSSHSLDQYRVWGTEYQTAVITNVTREHLDYHKTMEKYRRAKEKLFQNAKIAIVNLDMENPEDFLKFDNDRKIGYTTEIKNSKLQIPNKTQDPNLKSQIIFAENIEMGINYSKFKISAKGGSVSGRQNTDFSLHLPGQFNIENALAAICVGIAENISLEIMARALGKIKVVPGRFEFIPNDKGLNIIVDYAVTPDSLNKLYELVGQINIGKAKIISVFGSCGDRDRGKRPIMGEIVCNACDYAIVTNEDPYTEDPQRIIDEVCSGIKNKEKEKNFWKIMDRREAIKKALQLAKPGDFVVATGKGAEETMMIGKEMIPWNDKKVILEELNDMQNSF
jgi:UDP-N-acetylmuramoyl-L-alanyl-D-glutamate--2,6-diaminopimelate ligase